jgi:hypothetical protein
MPRERTEKQKRLKRTRRIKILKRQIFKPRKPDMSLYFPGLKS